MEFNVDKFSYRLISLMEEFNISQVKLSKKIGTSNVTISRYLSGERVPRLDVVSKIAGVFHVSLDYLLGFTDDKNINPNSGNNDVDISSSVKKLYSLDSNSHLTETQINLIKKLLLANKDFILSA